MAAAQAEALQPLSSSCTAMRTASHPSGEGTRKDRHCDTLASRGAPDVHCPVSRGAPVFGIWSR